MFLTRRHFLTIPACATFAAWRHASGLSRDNNNVLVVLQLAGGNDGLNTVVPYEDDQYGRSRSTLRLTGNQVHKIGSGLGFHPELRGFARLFQEGRLSVLQGVGYPNMHRDHNVGMRSWQTASLSPAEESGWLGRAADRAADPDAGNVPAIFVGQIAQPLAIHARQAIIPSILKAEDWVSPPILAGEPRPSGSGNPLLTLAAGATLSAQAASRKVAAVLKSGSGVSYPAFPLAQSLQTVAQLIRADIGIRIYLAELGGVSPGQFDNHANQAGNHALVLRELSESVTAFCYDLAHDKLLDRTLLMTYSEFGRQLTENGRHGTGHGAAAPVLLAGGKIKAGLVGAHPSLTDLDADAPKPHTDFRAVYATVLDRWLGMPSEPILGQSFKALDLLA